MSVVGFAVDRAVATITLDSPASRNALSAELVAELKARFGDAAGDPAVRAIVLAHTGSTFCAGNDLKEATEPGGPARSTARMVELFGLIVAARKPVVARVDGHVRAGGLGLIGACDIVVAGPAATFSFTEARLGLAPAIISLTTFTRMAERDIARYCLTGDIFDGVVAERIGLVSEFAGDPDAALARLLESLRACSPDGLAATKELTARRVRDAFAGGSAQMQELSARLFASEPAREGMQAFLEKRPPRWLIAPD